MNKFYPTYQERRAEGSIALLTDTIHVALLDATYVYSASHEFYTSAVASLVGSAVALAGKTVTVGGKFDADNTVFTALTGAVATQFVLIKWSGSAATSPLIYHCDTAIGLPFTPTGVDVTIQWDALGIFTG